jgi:tetratricopeptide (TPR) repeat protein
MKKIEESIIQGEEARNKGIDEIINLIETIEEKYFNLNMVYARTILLKNYEHSLDDAWCILSNIDEGKINFEWNYILAKTKFEIEIYEEALEYIKNAIKINENNNNLKKLYKNIIGKLK